MQPNRAHIVPHPPHQSNKRMSRIENCSNLLINISKRAKFLYGIFTLKSSETPFCTYTHSVF